MIQNAIYDTWHKKYEQGVLRQQSAGTSLLWKWLGHLGTVRVQWETCSYKFFCAWMLRIHTILRCINEFYRWNSIAVEITNISWDPIKWNSWHFKIFIFYDMKGHIGTFHLFILNVLWLILGLIRPFGFSWIVHVIITILGFPVVHVFSTQC